MQTYTTDRLIFNFGFLLDGVPGVSTDVELDYPSVKLDDLLLIPLHGYFKASRTTQGIFIKGALHSQVSALCTRCNDNFGQLITIELDDHFYSPQTAPAGEYTIKDNGVLNLGPLVRETALLSVPIQTVCRDECQGLCIECGANLNASDCGCVDENIDPRMAVLKQLLES